MATITLISSLPHNILQSEEGSDIGLPKAVAESTDIGRKKGKKKNGKQSSKSSVNWSKQSKPSVNRKYK